MRQRQQQRQLFHRRDILQGIVLLGQAGFKLSHDSYNLILACLCYFSFKESVDKLSDSKKQPHESWLRQSIEVIEPALQSFSTLSLLKFQVTHAVTDPQLNAEQLNSLHSISMAFDFAIFLQSVLYSKKDSSYRLCSLLSICSVAAYGKSVKLIQSTCRGALGVVSILRGLCPREEKITSATPKRFQP